MSELPASILDPDEEVLWQGRVDLPSLIRRQTRRVLIAAGLSGIVLIVMIALGWGAMPRLLPILVVPVMLVAQGIARRNRERDIYLLTSHRVGVWSPPQGPAARLEGMEAVGSGALLIPFTALERIETHPDTVIVHPAKGSGHYAIWMTDLPDAKAVSDLIRTAAGV
ncbi:hypothetical protein [Aliiroseovarius subalbicans]|uniref:hypothetical protein n=1 Tax=Aliiroseovarius subalbicans TaxID=2925840 RepID=UPI001F59A87E|nr:hypothetical protein [Aliiroseovarius subalbicans]MCI2399585.1 hypothetical protein [Aliiroseovarius subalbicans]